MHVTGYRCSKCGLHEKRDQRFKKENKPYNALMIANKPCACGCSKYVIEVSDWA